MIKIICTNCYCEADVISYSRKEPNKLIIDYICTNCCEQKRERAYLYEKADTDKKSKEKK